MELADPIHNEQAPRIWEQYINDHILPPGMDPLIAASWERCRQILNPLRDIRLDKLRADHLLITQVANFDLISIARPVMEDICQFLEGTNTAVALVNGASYILDILGDEGMLDISEQFGITTGALTSEPQMGTNAFSLAITERFPVRVCGAEHFLSKFHQLADAAAPIFEPGGHPLGAIGLINLAHQHYPHTLALAVAGARAIEGQLQSDMLLAERNTNLAELNAILSAISEGILVWNSAGVLIHSNSVAAMITGIPSQSLVGRAIKDLIAFPVFIEDALQRRQQLTDMEANIKFGERSINCVVSLRFVLVNQDLIWTIVTLRQEKEVRQLVQHQVGAQAFSTMEDIAGTSPEIIQVRRQAHTAALAHAPIIIRGESGTGKNLLASAIHTDGPRRDGPFLVFPCSSIPAELVLNELLGYEEGGSARNPGGRPSKLELAHGGTLYFQDVEALPLEAQAILLNVLELGIVQRQGSRHAREVDVRAIASTTADIETMISQGSFRADLYYRLSSFEILLPALRTRTKDLVDLVERILERLSRQLNRPLKCGPGVIELLKKYPWPGNIRELESVLGRAAVLAGVSEIIAPMHLPEFIQNPVVLLPGSLTASSIQKLDEVEREAILQAARLCRGNVSQMARLLGISRTTLWRRMKAKNISPDFFRPS